MSLKKEILTYAYSYCAPHTYETIRVNIKPYKDDLSDLKIEGDTFYEFLKNVINNKVLLNRIEEAISTEKTENLCINSAFIGWIIGFVSGVVFYGIVNYLIR